MRFHPPLLPGTLVRRYKRFLADIRLEDGSTVTAHTPNPGSMLGCSTPGWPVRLSQSSNPKRKLAYTWELVDGGTGWIGVNPARANALAEEAIGAGRIAELAGYASLRREVPYGQASRVDLLLEHPLLEHQLLETRTLEGGAEQGHSGPACYVEVKSVTLGRPPLALFPDAVSQRASKHMAELAAQVRAGARACVLFIVQREDCTLFAPADEIDPTYGRALRQAAAEGVQVLAYGAEVSPQGITVCRPLPIDLRGGA